MNIATNTVYSSSEATSILLMTLMDREQQSSASKKVVPMVNFEDYRTMDICLSLMRDPIYSIRADSSPSTSKSAVALGKWLEEAKVVTTKVNLPAPDHSIQADLSPSTTSKSTGAIGNWLKEAKLVPMVKSTGSIGKWLKEAKLVPKLNFEDYQTKTMCLSLTASVDSIRAACSPSTSKSTAKFYEKPDASPLMAGGLRKASTTQQSRQRKGARFPLAATKKRSSSVVKAHSMRTFRAQWSNGASSGDQYVNREVFARRLQRGTLVVKTRR
jgi:endogenous inhibitor of DNA gyrase (YacG/DUF329 family)